MTVGNNVHAFIRSLQRHSGDAITLLHTQLLAASYQHALLRDAYAIAKALGRILVLPPLYAWCDWEPDAHVLLTCVAVHNEGQVPYQGPSDLYVNIEVRGGRSGARDCSALRTLLHTWRTLASAWSRLRCLRVTAALKHDACRLWTRVTTSHTGSTLFCHTLACRATFFGTGKRCTYTSWARHSL